MSSFTRKGQPVQIPFTAQSASAEFVMPPSMPMPDRKTFIFINATPFDVRLEGTPVGSAFIPVTSTTGYIIPARSSLGPFRSKNPAKLSCQAFSTPGNKFDGTADFTDCVLELVYGEGE